MADENDNWTDWTAFWERNTKFVSNGYYAGELVDIVASELGAQQAYINLSYYGLIIGLLAGWFTARGTAYVHKKRNKRNQPQVDHSHGDHDEHEEHQEHEHGHSRADHSSHAHSHGGHHVEDKLKEKDAPKLKEEDAPKLKEEDVPYFIGDCITHACDFSSSFTFLLNLTSSPTFGVKIIFNLLFIIVGSTAARAAVRSCENNLITGNTDGCCGKPHVAPNKKADNWTNWYTIVDACSDTSSAFYWAADFTDTLISFFGSAKLAIAFLTFSWPAVVLGLIAGAMALGAVYSHRVQSIDDNGKPLTEGEEKIPLTPMQRASLVGDVVSHTSEIAAPLNFVYELASKAMTVPKWTKPLVQCTATFFAATASYAPVRSCKNAMKKKNYREENPPISTPAPVPAPAT